MAFTRLGVTADGPIARSRTTSSRPDRWSPTSTRPKRSARGPKRPAGVVIDPRASREAGTGPVCATPRLVRSARLVAVVDALDLLADLDGRDLPCRRAVARSRRDAHAS